MERDVKQLEKDVLELVRKAEDGAMEAGRKWAKAVGELVPLELPAMRQVVKEAFDFTDEVLKLQRQFAYNVLEAVSTLPKARMAPHTARGPARPATHQRTTTAHPKTKTTRVA